MSDPVDDDLSSDTIPMRIGIVGTGAVAAAFARVLGGGPSDVLLWGRRSGRARELAQETGVRWAGGLASMGDRQAVILAVSDGAAGTVARQLAEALGTGHAPGKAPAFLHTGGARTGVFAMGGPAGTMAPAARFELGSIHPLVAVPRVLDASVHPFDGMPFAIEASGQRARELARAIVGALGGDVLELPRSARGADPEAVKLRYHALATMVATGVVTLVDRAAAALSGTPEEAQALRTAYGKLASSAARNVTSAAGPDALTGPLARGDEALLQDHKDALGGEAIEGLYADVLRAARGMLGES